MAPSKNRWIAFALGVVVILACVPTFAPGSEPIPTYDPNSINTAIVQTANAAATQTAALLQPTFTPSVTPQPSNTPTVTPSPTETFIFLLATFTPKSNPTAANETNKKPYACELISQSPEDNTSLAAGADFDMRWQVKNAGTKIWTQNDFDFHYVSGDALHKISVYDFYKDIFPGNIIDLIVVMKAPSDPGTYKTFWKMNVGKTEFCQLSLTISVK